MRRSEDGMDYHVSRYEGARVISHADNYRREERAAVLPWEYFELSDGTRRNPDMDDVPQI